MFPGPGWPFGVVTIAFYMDHFGFGNFRLKSTTRNIALPAHYIPLFNSSNFAHVLVVLPRFRRNFASSSSI